MRSQKEAQNVSGGTTKPGKKKKEHAESLKKETVLKGRKENKIREEFDF